jgi:hypothetical protein
MRFTADYDSEEEAYPVNDANRGSLQTLDTSLDYTQASSEDEDDDAVDYFFDPSSHHSPRATRDAWVNLTRVIGKLTPISSPCTAKTKKSPV